MKTFQESEVKKFLPLHVVLETKAEFEIFFYISKFSQTISRALTTIDSFSPYPEQSLAEFLQDLFYTLDKYKVE